MTPSVLHGSVSLPVFVTSHTDADNPSIVAFLVKGRDGAYDRLERSVKQIVEERLSKSDGPTGHREEPVSMNLPAKPYIN